jgi:hypothetical protein
MRHISFKGNGISIKQALTLGTLLTPASTSTGGPWTRLKLLRVSSNTALWLVKPRYPGADGDGVVEELERGRRRCLFAVLGSVTV